MMGTESCRGAKYPPYITTLPRPATAKKQRVGSFEEMAEASKALQYGDKDKQNFKAYFLQPPKKVGRPKKRKRGRPAKKGKKPADDKAKQSTLQTESNTVDLTKHGSAVLGSHLEGAMEAEKRDKKKRIN